jgi:hypothetical protein
VTWLFGYLGQWADLVGGLLAVIAGAAYIGRAIARWRVVLLHAEQSIERLNAIMQQIETIEERLLTRQHYIEMALRELRAGQRQLQERLEIVQARAEEACAIAIGVRDGQRH